ncbi:uncharacterized protein LOC134209785 [Armigeres subalbatus]|uniref:uncharacterized protein LOC134209785 n=1 Tax=Armigeres subalbatus TaxID=124917 RepID=UPI002ED272A6
MAASGTYGLSAREPVEGDISVLAPKLVIRLIVAHSLRIGSKAFLEQSVGPIFKHRFLIENHEKQRKLECFLLLVPLGQLTLSSSIIMSAADRKLRGLKNRKRSIITSFAAIRTFVSSYKAEKDKCEVPVRLENLIDLWKEFNTVQTELETLEDDDEVLEAYLKERTEFENAYYRAKDHWDVLLIHLLSTRLDSSTRRDWEDFAETNECTKFHQLIEFLQRRVNVLETVKNKSYESAAISKKPNPPRTGSHGAVQQGFRSCPVCSSQHFLYQCESFAKMTVNEKEVFVRRNKLCRNCLRRGHMAKDCSSESYCRKCRGRHHTQLCYVSKSDSTSNAASSQPASVNQLVSSSAPSQPSMPSGSQTSTPIVHTGITSCISSDGSRTKVLLATAIVMMVDDEGSEHPVRALLDSGSECCFATERVAQRMRVHRSRVNLPIAGIGQASTEVRCKFLATVKSRVSSYSTTIEAFVLPKVTIDLPSISVDASSWTLPTGIQLADPSFYQSGAVDLVLGAEVFFDLFNVAGRIPLGDTLPPLINSVFGWVISGKTPQRQSRSPITCNVATTADIQRSMEKFWKIEDDAAIAYSPEEAYCEKFFRETTVRGDGGRYIVRIPFKDGALDNLGTNRRTAFHRFRLIEARLGRDPNLAAEYRKFMDEYEKLGHMKRVDESEATLGPAYFLPHHPVIREESSTTKVRVVFDASCRSTTGVSLNEVMLVGPVVQEDLRSIIMRSRLHPVMLIADVAKMYRQITLSPDDSRLHLIFWRASPSDTIQIYKLLTVTYGTASAPYLATRVLKKLADDEEKNYPLAARATRDDFYVDDFFSGARSVAEAVKLRKQMEEMFNSAGMQLRKWASNIPSALQGVSNDNRALQSSVEFDKDQSIKTLGLHWEPHSDQLKYLVPKAIVDPAAVVTKRSALSCIARLFDPLGLVGPVVVRAKMFMQALWGLQDDNDNQYDWDKELPDMKDQWQQSIPRLELCGALLSAELYVKVAAALRITSNAYFWVDSTTVLSWLKATPSTWSTFVGNRVSKIQHKSQNCEWNHVAGRENPADVISRGLAAADLMECERWWRGPSWLRCDKDAWPIPVDGGIDQEAFKEARKSSHITASPSPTFAEDYVNQFSNFQHMLRITAYWRRYFANLRLPMTERVVSSPLTTVELQGAELALIRLVQMDSFPTELKAVEAQQLVSSRSRLRWFNPLIDSDGVLRIGGRIGRSAQSYDSCHQILLPGSHPFSSLLVRCQHERLLHAATQLLMNTIRLRYWILGGRNVIRRVVHRCVTCFRAKPKVVEQFMAELPVQRVTASRPFSIVGIDFWGPIYLKPRHRRDSPPKAYVAVFICFSTKAVHLELVVDLSTAKFLQAFRRFVARRGLCAEVFSDNGKNFVGAANELRRLLRAESFRQSFASECSNNGIHWHFNPPRASHFGGLWEAAINSAQKHFVRVLGDRKLPFDDMETLLVQIDTCLNSRPLTKLSDDPCVVSLRIISSSVHRFNPSQMATIHQTNRLHSWQQIQKLLQDVWKRWHVEYLQSLQPRSKWLKQSVQLKENQLVIIVDENQPPMRWPIARVKELHPGKDGVVRVVTLQTTSGLLTRPTAKICILPIPATVDDQSAASAASQSG